MKSSLSTMMSKMMISTLWIVQIKRKNSALKKRSKRDKRSKESERVQSARHSLGWLKRLPWTT